MNTIFLSKKRTLKQVCTMGLLVCMVSSAFAENIATVQSVNMPSENEFIHPDIAAKYCANPAVAKNAILAFINKHRTQGTFCQGKPFPAVSAITWNDRLAVAAKRHADDMAKGDFLDHTGSDGTLPDKRVTEAGYVWTDLRENVASGTRSLGGTLDSIMESGLHCENVMNPTIQHVGMACGYNPDSLQSFYWTQVFATK